MDFTKIKYDGEKVEMAWQEDHEQDSRVTKLTSDDPPHETFQQALQAFLPEVIQLLELPSEYSIGARVRGVSVSYSDDKIRGLVVTALKDVSGADAPVVLNTPHLQEAVDLDSGGHFLSRSMVARLDALLLEAERYVGGHRAQGSLFEGEAA